MTPINYPASIGILIIFFIWVLIATTIWSKRIKKLTEMNKYSKKEIDD